jgi:hypothetical protein
MGTEERSAFGINHSKKRNALFVDSFTLNTEALQCLKNAHMA